MGLFGARWRRRSARERCRCTSAPLPRVAHHRRTIGVTLFATSNRPETAWVADIESSIPTAGRAASRREHCSARSGPSTRPQLDRSGREADSPVSPVDRAAATPVVPGELTRYDIEVFPTLATVPAGHRIRLTLTTSDTPHLAPTAPSFLGLLGGCVRSRPPCRRGAPSWRSRSSVKP